jgi:predicted NACHT family NTPase
MIEQLITWTYTQEVDFFTKEVIRELAKRAPEDYVKDFFKWLLFHLNGSSINTKILEKANIEAIKDFLQLVKQELEEVELDESQLERYIEPLEQFLKNKYVLRTLGSAFNHNVKILDTKKLATIWNQINPPLPDDFDWEIVSKKYSRRVKKIIMSSDELRKILDSKKLDKLANPKNEIRLDFDLEKYKEAIQEQYGNLKLESLDTSGYGYNELKLWRMFIPQNVRESQEFMPQVYEIPKEYLQRLKETEQLEKEFSPEQLESLRRRYLEQPVRSVLELIEDTKYKYLVILGDPGSGKSTLLKYIALQWAELPLKYLPLKPIPLLIELRTYVRNNNSNQCQNFLEFLEKGSNVTCHLPQQKLDAKLKNGDAIVMFDGLDEIFDLGKREEVITDIKRFINDYKNVRVIVTSRVIGYQQKKLRDADFNHFMLQDLESEKVEDFIQCWHDLTYQDEGERERKRERLKLAIKDSSAIKQLSGNPLLLTMMAILNRHQELPRDRTELYHQASRVLLQQWDMERALIDAKINPITIDYKDKQAILRRVADFMQQNKEGLAGNLIHGDDLENIIKDYLKSVDINNVRVVARALMEQLQSRNFILCFVGAGYYAFVHRTFLEFFCAWSFAWQFKETQSLGIDGLINDVFADHWRDEKWHEVLRLIAGMIDAKFVGDIISYLMEQDGEEEKFLNLFLAGKCLFEVRSRQGIDDVESRLLNRLKDLTGYELGYFYEAYDENADLVREIRTQAVEIVATTWRDDPSTFTWLKQRVVSDDDKDVRLEAVQQIATAWKHEPGILDLLQQRVVSDDDEDVRLEAVRQIATAWKHEPGILDLLQQWVVSDESLQVRREAVRQIATGWKHEPGILDLLQQRVESDESWQVRREAVRQIATGWKHEPGILDLLQQWLVSDESWDVRVEALQQIATGWKHEPGILDLLQQRLVSDESPYVRSEAVRKIATGWKHKPGILDLLQQRLVSDESPYVRREVLRKIATGWKHEPGILDLLQQRLVSDESPYVRSEALRKIATGWKHEPGILELLKQRVVSDESPYVRSEAVRQIATGWKHEPGILDLLQQRVVSDESSDVRVEALQQIAIGWKHEPGTFELFYDTALNDPFQYEDEFETNPRQTALELIVKQYPDHPQTLSLLQDRAENDPDEQLQEWAKNKLLDI